MKRRLNILKCLLLLAFSSIIPVDSDAQITAYFSTNVFNTPQNEPYLETYVTLSGNSLAAGQVNGHLENSVTILFTLFKDSTIVKANKYRLTGPPFDTIIMPPVFIDQQRYSIPNGQYTIKLSVSDNYAPNTAPLVLTKNITVNYSGKDVESSEIQALESYKKALVEGKLSKSGFDLIPYSVNYYPETNSNLAFYFESYNLNKIIGEGKAFVYAYYLEKSDNPGTPLANFGHFRKMTAGAVNPLLSRLDISQLGTGSYNLVIDIKDENNKLQLQRKYFFQRLNRAVDLLAIGENNEKRTLAEYFGQCNNVDTLKMFVECLWPIAGTVDKERIINQSLKKDPQIMKNFIVDFWQRRAADTANPLSLWAAYYKNVQTVMTLFKCGKQPGYYTDRGRVYLQYGAPSQRSVQLMENNTFPYEIWMYYRTADQVNGQFFSNRRFVFVNKMLGDDCYMLIHSDMRGEINNPRWQFEIARRNNNGAGNPDQTTPAGTQDNQFNEIFTSPR
ncbi:MAG: GWxTD domain-containing protein [Bacteroidia bacterium]|nr:GWxTD domain-containing protein [Bacteroidia bacterium]